MSISKENVVVVYVSGDADSEAFADAYVELHGLESEQKLPLTTASTEEILGTHAEYKSQVIDPVNTYIDGTLSHRNILAVLLGMRVPAGFYDDGDIVAGTSRLTRGAFSFEKQLANPYFNKQVHEDFTSADLANVRVCTRIDAANITDAVDILDNTDVLLKQLTVNGKFYIDPYSDLHGTAADSYTNDLLDFSVGTLQALNLDTFTTKFINEYVDSIVPSLINDSFYWGWFTDRGSQAFFRSNAEIRGFFYNADYDAAITLRTLDTGNWCPIALKSGYVATAGAMSNPGIDGFLRPTPFFEVLRRGRTLGEAFLYSMPYLNWTIDLIGDPLVKFSFPKTDVPADTFLDEEEAWFQMVNTISEAAAYYSGREGIAFDILDTVVRSGDVATTVKLTDPSYSLYIAENEGTRNGRFKNVSENLIKYALNRFQRFLQSRPLDINDYLELRDIKLSQAFVNSLTNPSIIKTANVVNNGDWDLEFIVQDESPGEYLNYKFEVDISLFSDFSTIAYTFISSSINNWQYEKTINNFEQIPILGVPSSHVGRRVRYRNTVSQRLDPGDIFYWRVRQRAGSGVWAYRTNRAVVFK